jgi:hypothetical protein
MSELSRRAFLTRSSVALAAGGAVSAVPGLGAVLASTETEATGAAATDAEIASADTAPPLVAHIQDLRNGLISVYHGEREISLTDRALAARLFRATQ